MTINVERLIDILEIACYSGELSYFLLKQVMETIQSDHHAKNQTGPET